MVAISLYKGNLHKVSDVPRKWLMPTPQISVKDFKTLLRRRSRALSLLPHPTLSASDPNPSPNSNPKRNSNLSTADRDDDNCEIKDAKENDGELENIAQLMEQEYAVEGVRDGMRSDARDQDHCLGETAAAAVEVEHQQQDEEEEAGAHDVVMEKIELNTVEEQHEVGVVTEEEENKKDEEEPHNPTPQMTKEEDTESNKNKRKREVEEKLKILKEKKHNLVQVLKQIQNAEEELKRRNSIQGMASHPSVPLQIDIPNDTGSITRLNTPRVGSDGILLGEMEGGEPDGMLNHNTDTRHLLRMSSTSPSPSSDSQHKKPAFSVVPHTARTSLGFSSSPSRFAPTGQHGQISNLPTVSVSGTNYVASSPSPAASGGTSVFRENRIPSPWN